MRDQSNGEMKKKVKINHATESKSRVEQINMGARRCLPCVSCCVHTVCAHADGSNSINHLFVKHKEMHFIAGCLHAIDTLSFHVGSLVPCHFIRCP